MKYFESEDFNLKEIKNKFAYYVDNKYVSGYAYQVMSDIFDMVCDNYKYEVVDNALSSVNPESFIEVCQSVEWGDAIHGNGSGSYTMDRNVAIENITENYMLTCAVLEDFFGKQVPMDILNNPETIDVLIRFTLIPDKATEVFYWWQNNAIYHYGWEDMGYTYD